MSKKTKGEPDAAAVRLIDQYLQNQQSSYADWQKKWEEKEKKLEEMKKEEFNSLFRAAVLPYADEFLLLLQDDVKAGESHLASQAN
ncbi:MAG: hypothetical protein LKE53_06435 [Oscillospiraceae bacterium]|jgi:hypothetical protein|nr:hypothetical protein [Oscillospiraceae bacterium]